jgi:hypothetical protein
MAVVPAEVDDRKTGERDRREPGPPRQRPLTCLVANLQDGREQNRKPGMAVRKSCSAMLGRPRHGAMTGCGQCEKLFADEACQPVLTGMLL